MILLGKGKRPKVSLLDLDKTLLLLSGYIHNQYGIYIHLALGKWERKRYGIKKSVLDDLISRDEILFTKIEGTQMGNMRNLNFNIRY